MRVPLLMLVLVLSGLYAAVFGWMLYVSVLEQVISPALAPPRYASPPHVHSRPEWALIILPAIAGGVGTLASAGYLLRAWARTWMAR